MNIEWPFVSETKCNALIVLLYNTKMHYCLFSIQDTNALSDDILYHRPKCNIVLFASEIKMQYRMCFYIRDQNALPDLFCITYQNALPDALLYLQTLMTAGTHIKDHVIYLISCYNILLSLYLQMLLTADTHTTLCNFYLQMLLTAGPQLRDHAINLAYPQTFRLGDVFNDVIAELGVSAKLHVDESVAGNHFYLYPSVIRGPIDVTKAVNLLHWSPTPWREAIAATVAFHEAAPLDPRFTRQFDDVIQIMVQQMFRDRKTRFFEALEQLYNVKLDHFKYPKDEL